jgi:hypothetical protein
MSSLADIVLIVLKCLDVLSWDWWIFLALPFAIAIGGTLLFALLYLFIKLFVSLII